eukprot:11703660-Karenia_brevis.AAC.1
MLKEELVPGLIRLGTNSPTTCTPPSSSTQGPLPTDNGATMKTVGNTCFCGPGLACRSEKCCPPMDLSSNGHS